MDSLQNTILYDTVVSNDVPRVQQLIELGADVNGYGGRSLIYACQYGTLDMVECLVQHGANISVGIGEPLKSASYRGNLLIVQYLIKMGADVLLDDNRALRYAVAGNHLDVLIHLVDSGAKANDCALVWACSLGFTDIVKYLISRGADASMMDNTCITQARLNGHKDIVEILLQHGAQFRKEY